MTRLRFVGILFLLVACLARVAGAKTSIDISVGFDGTYKSGAWTPLRVTVADTTTRDAVLDIWAPQPGSAAMTITSPVTLNPQVRSFVYYVPLAYSANELRATLRDARTGKLLAEFGPATPGGGLQGGGAGGGSGAWTASGGNTLAVVGADSNFLTRVALQLPRQAYKSSFARVYSRELPAAAIGYDGVDLLVLDGNTIDAMDRDQQDAVVAYVYGGGRLILWPGSSPLLPDAPLRMILPAAAGDVGSVTVSPKHLKAAGLPERFASLPARPLTPRPRAVAFPLLQTDALRAVAGDAGLGRVVLLPTDASILQFQGDAQTAFWQAIIDNGFARQPKAAPASPADSSPDLYANAGAPYPGPAYPDYGVDPQAAAMSRALDAIGRIPGTGSLGFGYIAALLAALMLVVGPVDWFVLRLLGKQPWTWVTTAGWIGVLTFGAIYVGHVFRSGELHLRTLGVIDQADGQVVSRRDALLIYAPRSAEYPATVPPHGWWQSIGDGSAYGNSGYAVPVQMQQDYRGNRPRPMWINVWNYQFLQATTLEIEPARVRLSIKSQAQPAVAVVPSSTAPTSSTAAPPQPVPVPPKPAATIDITGSITLLGAGRCEEAFLQHRGRFYRVTQPLVANVRLDLAGNLAPVAMQQLPQPPAPDTAVLKPYQVYVGNEPMADTTPWVSLCAIAYRNGQRMRTLAEQPDVVLFYGKLLDEPPQITLDDPAAVSGRTVILRAMAHTLD